MPTFILILLIKPPPPIAFGILRAQDLIETHNLNKKKTLSTAQAVDLIRSILNNAQMKRPQSKRSLGDSSSKSMEEAEKVLDDLQLGNLYIGDETNAVPDEAAIEEPEPDQLFTSKDSDEMSAIMALEDDRIKAPIEADTNPETDGGKDEGGTALHGDRKPQSSAASTYEPSKSTATGMVCALKDHRCVYEWPTTCHCSSQIVSVRELG